MNRAIRASADPMPAGIALERTASVDLPSDANRANEYGTDVEIFRWKGRAVWADTRTGTDESAHRILVGLGFVRIEHPGILSSHELPAQLPWLEQQIRATTAAGMLTNAGFTVNLEPDVYTDAELLYSTARYSVSRPDAALRTSPAAGTQCRQSPPPPATVAPPPGRPTATTLRRPR